MSTEEKIARTVVGLSVMIFGSYVLVSKLDFNLISVLAINLIALGSNWAK